MVASHWIVRGEYRYADFGTVTNTDTRFCPAGVCTGAGPSVTQVASYDLDPKTHTVTFGLAYKFGP
jgi:outer membrane immunogenic protein